MFEDKRIMITGGTGSVGQMLCKNLNCKLIRVYSRDEFKQKHGYQKKHIEYMLGDVRDKDRFDMAIKDIDIIIHTAALKQVEAGEFNPFEFVKTNVYGTQNVIECALGNNVEQVLLISTDKAVNPVNLYGATKLCAEKLITAANNCRGCNRTQFKYVRYGNVWGSRGSVLDAWTKGEFTVRDRDATRFHLTLDNAIKLIFTALIKNDVQTLPENLNAYNLGDLVDAYQSVTQREPVYGFLPSEEKLHETLDGKSYSNEVLLLTTEKLKTLISDYL